MVVVTLAPLKVNGEVAERLKAVVGGVQQLVAKLEYVVAAVFLYK